VWLASPAAAFVTGQAINATAARLAETLLVTGRLAEPALGSVVCDLDLDLDRQIAVLNLSVAALMTTRWIARRLKVPSGVDNIVIPGLCEGDVDPCSRPPAGRCARARPTSARRPSGTAGRPSGAELEQRDARVLAVINDVQSLSREQVSERPEAYRREGADVIDVGLSLDRPWLTDPKTIAALRERGRSLSIDALVELRRRRADAEMLMGIGNLTELTEADAAGCMRSTASGSSARPTGTRCSSRLTWTTPRTRFTWARS
jgi:hypothetical protein